MTTSKSKCDIQSKVAPKLTPARQRVYDWLGESPDRCLFISSFNPLNPSAWTMGKSNDFRRLDGPRVRIDTAIALVPYLHRTSKPEALRDYDGRYIHPKFAPEANDDSETDN